MSRKIPVINVIPTVPNYSGAIVVGQSPDNPTGDWTQVFTPGTVFEVDGGSIAGRYSVASPLGFNDVVCSFKDGKTTIKVSQYVKSCDDLSNAVIINCSTFYLNQVGGPAIIVQKETENTQLPITLFGNGTSAWGEVLLQNLINMVQCFASEQAPSSPMIGMLWKDIVSNTLKTWTGTEWQVVNSQLFAPAKSFKHIQTTEAFSWTIEHNLSTDEPFIVSSSFFVNSKDGVKPILPSDVEYTDKDTIKVTFSKAYSGYALIRP